MPQTTLNIGKPGLYVNTVTSEVYDKDKFWSDNIRITQNVPRKRLL